MKNIYRALAAFQQECPTIHKGTQGYGYSYADLPTILKTINPLLEKHGLGFSQPVDLDTIQTILFHVESGETITSSTLMPTGVELKGMNQFQVDGSKITYYRRYALSSLLGIVTDKDTDAGGQQVAKTEKPALTPESSAWHHAIKHLQASGTIAQIKKKYTLTAEHEEQLKNDTL